MDSAFRLGGMSESTSGGLHFHDTAIPGTQRGEVVRVLRVRTIDDTMSL